MRILVIGGYGLIGGAVVTRLTAHGHIVFGAGRNIEQAQRRFPEVRWVQADLASASPAAWAEILKGIDAVVNCAGALRGGREQQNGHADGLRRLGEAAGLAGVKRIVHVSSTSPEGATTPRGKAKPATESPLSGVAVDWVVLRPGLVVAPAAFGATALLRALAAFPGFVPAFHAQSKVQVASLIDVADAVAAAVQPGAPKGIAIDLVNSEQITIAHMLMALRAWLGAPPAPLVPVPAFFAKLSAAVADGLGYLGWRSPMSSSAGAQLSSGAYGDPTAAMRYLGVRMRGLSEILALAPSGVQERWFARLYLVKPLAFLTLTIFWTASGVTGLMRKDAAVALLTPSGMSPATAGALVTFWSVVGILLGLLVCWRRTARATLYSMIVASIGYLAVSTLLRPDLWMDPLGPLVKIIPCTVMAFAALAILDER